MIMITPPSPSPYACIIIIIIVVIIIITITIILIIVSGSSRSQSQQTSPRQIQDSRTEAAPLERVLRFKQSVSNGVKTRAAGILKASEGAAVCYFHDLMQICDNTHHQESLSVVVF